MIAYIHNVCTICGSEDASKHRDSVHMTVTAVLTEELCDGCWGPKIIDSELAPIPFTFLCRS